MSKTIISTHYGLRVGKPGVISVVKDRPCKGAYLTQKCVERATCGRHRAYLEGSDAPPLLLPRTDGCACHYKTT